MYIQYCNQDEIVDRELAQLKDDRMVIFYFQHCILSMNINPYSTDCNGSLRRLVWD